MAYHTGELMFNGLGRSYRSQQYRMPRRKPQPWDAISGLGVMTTSAISKTLATSIPEITEAQNAATAIITAQQQAVSTAAAAQLVADEAKATAILATFFAVRKLIKENKARILSLGVNIIPAAVIAANNDLLTKTDVILADLYIANGKVLLPGQDANDIPVIIPSLSVAGFGATTSATEVNQLAVDTNVVSNAISNAISNVNKTNKGPFSDFAGIFKWVFMAGIVGGVFYYGRKVAKKKGWM